MVQVALAYTHPFEVRFSRLPKNPDTAHLCSCVQGKGKLLVWLLFKQLLTSLSLSFLDFPRLAQLLPIGTRKTSCFGVCLHPAVPFFLLFLPLSLLEGNADGCSHRAVPGTKK